MVLCNSNQSNKTSMFKYCIDIELDREWVCLILQNILREQTLSKKFILNVNWVHHCHLLLAFQLFILSQPPHILLCDFSSRSKSQPQTLSLYQSVVAMIQMRLVFSHQHIAYRMKYVLMRNFWHLINFLLQTLTSIKNEFCRLQMATFFFISIFSPLQYYYIPSIYILLRK